MEGRVERRNGEEEWIGAVERGSGVEDEVDAHLQHQHIVAHVDAHPRLPLLLYHPAGHLKSTRVRTVHTSGTALSQPGGIGSKEGLSKGGG